MKGSLSVCVSPRFITLLPSERKCTGYAKLLAKNTTSIVTRISRLVMIIITFADPKPMF